MRSKLRIISTRLNQPMRAYISTVLSSNGHAAGQGVSFLAPALQLAATVVLVLLLVKIARAAYKLSSRRTNFTYSTIESADLQDVVITDCIHPKAPTLTHHKGHNNPTGLRAADTSTGIVINALKTGWWGGEAYSYCQKGTVSTNHFDVDSFLSVFCYINRALALQYEPVLRHAARIGDFREAFLSPELVAAFGAEDGLTNVRDAFTALKLCCWLNTIEKKQFSAPYEKKDCTEKFDYFLPRFAAVLQDPESAWAVWQDEYKQVVGGFDALQGPGCSIEEFKAIGLVILQAPDPLHYYSLFSHTYGYDVVLTMYDHNRYEVECKYTQYVVVSSRPVWPRLDLVPLATVLNSIESGQPEGTFWVASRLTDPGSLLRLDRPDMRVSKAQRYGHPCDRPIASSSIPPATMSAIVQSFLEFGMQGLRPKHGGWTWDELHTINQSIPWQTWINAVLDQHEQGELGSRTMLDGARVSRRFSNDALPMEPGPSLPPMRDSSHIMEVEDVKALAAALPARFFQGRWQMVYCTKRDGISLHTLYRKAAGCAPTVLVVKDTGGYVFGCFAVEPWRIHPRFYGTGETCVFRLHPQRLQHQWQRLKDLRNDFFQFSTHEGLGVGGAGHFAMWLDNDLLEGSSNPCDTFACPCLASAAEFQVAAVELWHIA